MRNSLLGMVVLGTALAVIGVVNLGPLAANAQQATDPIIGQWYANNANGTVVARFSNFGDFQISALNTGDNPDFGYWNRDAEGRYSVWYVHAMPAGVERTELHLVMTQTPNGLVLQPESAGGPTLQSHVDTLSGPNMQLVSAQLAESLSFTKIPEPPGW